MSPIFITGGTGYIGKRLIKKLVEQGYDVTALVRKGSENKLPKGVRAIIADPFKAATFTPWIADGATYIQLLGVSHPSPRKKDRFRQVDLQSLKTSADAASSAGVKQFIYVSVAMTDSKLMKDYKEVRREGEAYLRTQNFPCTFIRPCYVLGPGHWWPLLLMPLYAVAEFVPAWKEKARQHGLITIKQMIETILMAIESPPRKIRTIEIKHLKRRILPDI